MVIFRPETAADVAAALTVLRHTSCSFAVKSGNHGKWAGESSISGGVLIDLGGMRQIKLSKDRSIVSLGPGNSWGEVFSALEPLGLTVVGGRSAGVGVGGFLLGGKLIHGVASEFQSDEVHSGGISWYSNLYGLGCDNIVAYEVVLANGSIVSASKDSLPDLYKALRGGTGNFGIVTMFHVKVYPYTGMWAGHKAFERKYGAEATKGFIDAGLISDSEDPKSFCLLSLITENKVWRWGVSLTYCDAVEKPAAFRAIDAIPALRTDCDMRSQTKVALQMEATYPKWLQYCIWTVATQVDVTTLRICCDIWMEELQPLSVDVEGLLPVLSIQYMTAGVIAGAGRNGGNVTGLARTQPFILYCAEPRWIHARDDMRVNAAINRAFKRMSVESKRLGTGHDYLYSNYSSQYQDALSSYGASSNEFLRKVSRKYDSDAVFQTLRSGGFDFSGPPRRVQELDPGVKL